MSAPRLTQALGLETPTRQSDGAGGFTEGWQALGTLWAELTPRSGRDAKSPAGTIAR
ncbi:head-tail adaptor protein, partial [Litorisediminicola beolgyonensis]